MESSVNSNRISMDIDSINNFNLGKLNNKGNKQVKGKFSFTKKNVLLGVAIITGIALLVLSGLGIAALAGAAVGATIAATIATMGTTGAIVASSGVGVLGLGILGGGIAYSLYEKKKNREPIVGRAREPIVGRAREPFICMDSAEVHKIIKEQKEIQEVEDAINYLDNLYEVISSEVFEKVGREIGVAYRLENREELYIGKNSLKQKYKKVFNSIKNGQDNYHGALPADFQEKQVNIRVLKKILIGIAESLRQDHSEDKEQQAYVFLSFAGISNWCTGQYTKISREIFMNLKKPKGSVKERVDFLLGKKKENIFTIFFQKMIQESPLTADGGDYLSHYENHLRFLVRDIFSLPFSEQAYGSDTHMNQPLGRDMKRQPDYYKNACLEYCLDKYSLEIRKEVLQKAFRNGAFLRKEDSGSDKNDFIIEYLVENIPNSNLTIDPVEEEDLEACKQQGSDEYKQFSDEELRKALEKDYKKAAVMEAYFEYGNGEIVINDEGIEALLKVTGNY